MGVDFTNKEKSMGQLKSGLAWCTDEFKELYFQDEFNDGSILTRALSLT